jgi:hypothetical protein
MMTIMAEICSQFLQKQNSFITKVVVFNWIVFGPIDLRQHNVMASPKILIKLKHVLFDDAINC